MLADKKITLEAADKLATNSLGRIKAADSVFESMRFLCVARETMDNVGIEDSDEKLCQVHRVPYLRKSMIDWAKRVYNEECNDE